MAETKKTGEQKDREAETPVARAERRDDWLPGLPDGLAPLRSVHTETAEELIETAEQLVAMARERFGSHTSKPRLETVARLFEEQAGKPPSVEKSLNTAIRELDVVEQTAALDRAYDSKMAGALNDFDKASLQSGSEMQQGYDAWLMAKRIYESEARAAGAIFHAEIEKAKRPRGEFSSDNSRREIAQVHHYTQSTAIAGALVQYEKTMATSANNLAKAFGQLVGVLYKSFSATATAEATLIAAANSASLTFWTGIEKALSRPRS